VTCRCLPGRFFAVLALVLLGAPGLGAAQDLPFAITLRDAATGDPVPCVTLRTVHQAPFTSDAHGVVAFHEPGLMGLDVFVQTSGPPWELPADGFGFTGVTLTMEPGGAAELEVSRTGPAGECVADDSASRLVAEGLPPIEERHGVRVVDAETGRGVPMVILTGPRRTWVTDSAGWAAIVEPDALGQTLSLAPWSHGYEAAAPVTVTLDRGGRSELALRRAMPAERLYRVTGGGIYRDSVLLGEPTPLAEPLLNALVVGLDSTHAVLHDGQMFWVWGDTLRPSYPLGHFRTSAATSRLPGDGGLDPSEGIDLTWFVRPEDGFARPVADIVQEGLVWTAGLVSVPGADGAELVAQFVHVLPGEGDGWTDGDRGLMRWNADEDTFERLVTFAPDVRAPPGGTAFHEGGYVYFTDVRGEPAQLYVVRVPASLEALSDPSTYETWTAMGPAGFVQRSGARPAYRWRTGSAPTVHGDVDEDRVLANHMADPFASNEVADHIGSILWNDWLGRYLRISARPFGDDAFLGETWLSAGDTPMGPWAWATKVVTHDDTSFYNPRQHPEFDVDGGRVVVFEGTYSAAFSGTPTPTPRYDYNQVMYRLDLERLTLPVPVYGRGLWTRDALPPGEDRDPAPFFALDRPADGAIALRWTGPDCAPRALAADGAGEVAFWAYPTGEASPQLVPLFAVSEPGRGSRYTLAPPPGGEPIAFVWPNPIDVPFPTRDHPGPVRVDGGSDQCDASGASTHLVATAPPAAAITWTWDGGQAEGRELTVSLDDGVHVFEVTARTADGVDRDVVVVEIGGARACGCAASAGGAGWLALCGALAALGPRRRRARSPGGR
jgi:hypothetical protein